MWAPPIPSRETLTPVFPSTRIGISAVVAEAGGRATCDSAGAVELDGPLFERHAASNRPEAMNARRVMFRMRRMKQRGCLSQQRNLGFDRDRECGVSATS